MVIVFTDNTQIGTARRHKIDNRNNTFVDESELIDDHIYDLDLTNLFTKRSNQLSYVSQCIR